MYDELHQELLDNIIVVVLFLNLTRKGGRSGYKNHVKKLDSILRHMESLQTFTDIKQVSTHSI